MRPFLFFHNDTTYDYAIRCVDFIKRFITIQEDGFVCEGIYTYIDHNVTGDGRYVIRKLGSLIDPLMMDLFLYRKRENEFLIEYTPQNKITTTLYQLIISKDFELLNYNYDFKFIV
jgi:hypothetical protein